MARTTHDRTRDHSGFELAEWVIIDPDIGTYSSGSNLQDVLEEIYATVSTGSGSAGLEFVIDGGGSAISTGIKFDYELPYAGVFTAVRMFADQSGSIVVDLWKDTYANYPPTNADSITASAKPTISSATKSQDTTLTGWTTSFSAGDVIRVNVDSCTSITKATVSLRIRRT